MESETKEAIALKITPTINTNKVESPVEGSITSDSERKLTVTETIEADLDAPYMDKRSITIEKVINFSLYRRVNSKVLDERKDRIGSCGTSSRVLSSNKDEVEAYFPNIVGVNPNHPEFTTKVKIWLNNISETVNSTGLTLNTSFAYDHYRDYLQVIKQEEVIEKSYNAANKQTLEDLKKAINTRIEKINFLESTKHKYGRPQNVTQYLMYRHCLLYKDVCKDLSLINSDSTIRFYIKDVNREEQLKMKLQRESNTAKRNYLTCIGDDDVFNAMFIQYCVLNAYPVTIYNTYDKFVKEQMLDEFSRKEPAKFNKYFTDKHLKIKTMIETLISRGELNRLEMNQNIISADGDFIGANIKDAVAYFMNPANAAYCKALENKLKFT